MATSFDKIENLALNLVEDYKIAKIHDKSEEGFIKYVDKFLLSAIPMFVQCEQSLDYDSDARMFNADLTDAEINILAHYWLAAWWQRETNNGAQIAQKLQISSSFKLDGASSQNFKEKRNVIDKIHEDIDRLTSAYLLAKLSSYDY
jgi:hypothetical protein